MKLNRYEKRAIIVCLATSWVTAILCGWLIKIFYPYIDTFATSIFAAIIGSGFFIVVIMMCHEGECDVD